MVRVWVAVVAMVLAGCGSFPTIDQERQVASSGLIGCRPAEIAITDNERYTWTSTCNGKVFQCTAAPAMACTQRMK